MEETTPKLAEPLQAGKLALAVVGLPVNSPAQPQVKLSELRGEKMLLLKYGHCFRDDALRICTRARMPFHPMFETDQFSSIFPMVAAGFGITLAPKMAARPAGECGLLPLEREAFRRVGYIRVRWHVRGTAQIAFVKWLREQCAAPPSALSVHH